MVSDKTHLHTLHWQTHIIRILIYTNSIFTMKFSNSEFKSGIVFYRFLLGHYNSLPDNSYLLQATKSIVP
jgi:hypothetical protein